MTVKQKQIFDPFNDRKARLVRNGLSNAFVSALQLMDFAIVEKRFRELAEGYDLPVYRDYLEDKTAHYRQVFDFCKEEVQGNCEIFFLTALLWKHRLFFEVHELLEQEWGEATGQYRKALQGLIQAAGYYLLLAAGNESGAAKLADKAIANIIENRDQLPKNLRLDRLIENLKKRDAEPLPLA